MGRPDGQLERALERIMLAPMEAAAGRRLQLADSLTGEYEQQVQLAVGGVAGNGWGSEDAKVNWELPFLYAPSQRRCDFPTPHFTPGFEFDSSSGELVIAVAHVVAWETNEQRWFTGATVRIAVCAPNSTAPTPYSGVAHLRFQGYATYAEGDEFQ